LFAGPYNNATLVGANSITAMGVWRDWLVVGGGAGLIGSTNGTTYYPYTTALTAPAAGYTWAPPVSNATVLGTSVPRAMTTITDASSNQILVVGGDAGRIGSWGGGWRTYLGAATPTAVEGASSWTARTTPNHVGYWRSVAYGNGLFIAVSNTIPL